LADALRLLEVINRPFKVGHKHSGGDVSLGARCNRSRARAGLTLDAVVQVFSA